MATKKSKDAFCRIVSGELRASVIWEDKEFMAILDQFPNTRGMALVIPKKHYDSYAFDMPDRAYGRLMLASKKVARMLEKGVKVHRVAMVMEGLGVNHVHIKLYPLHGLRHKYHMLGSDKRAFYRKYAGYLLTHMGPEADKGELEKIKRQIKGG